MLEGIIAITLRLSSEQLHPRRDGMEIFVSSRCQCPAPRSMCLALMGQRFLHFGSSRSSWLPVQSVSGTPSDGRSSQSHLTYIPFHKHQDYLDTRMI